MKPVIILGASRGLGAALAKHVCAQGQPVLGFSRKPPITQNPLFEHRQADFTKEAERVQDELLELAPAQIFCIAGGGPYGPYHERRFKDHEWAWRLTFVFPAQIVHALAKTSQIILVGSSVAEAGKDPQAASYSAAKHAQKGLYVTVREEPGVVDLRLFSPGYLDTEMLPKNARARELGVYSPSSVAKELWEWSLTPDKGGHRLYPKHPSC